MLKITAAINALRGPIVQRQPSHIRVDDPSEGPFWHFFHYSCQTRFFLEKVHLMFFVAEIQRQIVLKFQNFQMNSFEDIIVGSWSGPFVELGRII